MSYLRNYGYYRRKYGMKRDVPMKKYVIFNAETTEPIQTIEAGGICEASAYAGRWYGERMDNGEVDIAEYDWFWNEIHEEV